MNPFENSKNISPEKYLKHVYMCVCININIYIYT